MIYIIVTTIQFILLIIYINYRFSSSKQYRETMEFTISFDEDLSGIPNDRLQKIKYEIVDEINKQISLNSQEIKQ